MKKGLLWLSRIAIGVTAITTGVGLVYASHPEYFQYAFDFLGMTPDEIATASKLIGLMGGLGIATKVLKLGVNSDMLGLEVKYEQMLSKNDTKNFESIQMLLSALKEVQNLGDDRYKELSEKQDLIIKQQSLILQGQILSAQRVIDYDFTSEQQTLEAQEFINKVKEL